MDKYRIYYVDAEVMRFILRGKFGRGEAEAKLPKDDKPHNLQVDVVDPASTTDVTSKSS